jgi:hypothetical protein
MQVGEKKREGEGWRRRLTKEVRATRPKSDHLQSRSPSHSGEGKLRDPGEEVEGKSEEGWRQHR